MRGTLYLLTAAANQRGVWSGEDNELAIAYLNTWQFLNFAEGTEAYFYHNDFYPFVRAELKQHDPTLHDALENIWGRLR